MTELILVTHQSGDDYEEIVDAANAAGGSINAVVEHLARWDYGAETDADSASFHGTTTLAELQALAHQLHEGDHGGLHYWLLLDHHLRFYALYRQPLADLGD